MKNFKKRNNGYVLMEIIFYILLFAILSIAVINSMITMTKSFKETTIQSELIQGGDIMEKISREIRQAYGINSISSTSLKLNTKNEADESKIVEFSLLDSSIRFLENDVFIDNINTQNIIVTNLAFVQINTAKGASVKISFSIKSRNDSQDRTQDFYDTVVLRGDY